MLLIAQRARGVHFNLPPHPQPSKVAPQPFQRTIAEEAQPGIAGQQLHQVQANAQRHNSADTQATYQPGAVATDEPEHDNTLRDVAGERTAPQFTQQRHDTL